MTPDQAKELIAGPFGEAALKAVAGYVSPIFWAVEDEEGREFVPNNGTIFFVDAGHGAFGVTANHVYQGYLDAKAAYPRVDCGIGRQCFVAPPSATLPFDPEARLIDQSQDPDIATFRITAEELKQLGTTTITVWPPVIPEVGQSIAFAGFPGRERRPVGPRELSFAPYPVLVVATSVNERYISCRFDREFLVPAPGFGLPAPNYDTGGISGAPLLTVVERNGLQHWALGGVVCEGNPNLEIILAARADCILPDGKLRRENRP